MLESRLLQGCCDIHLHVAPSLIPRSADIVTVARQAEAAGYRAIVIKDHHYNSAPACDQIQRYLFNGSPLRIFGSIALNNSVGGVNPYVVEAAINFGVKNRLAAHGFCAAAHGIPQSGRSISLDPGGASRAADHTDG